MIEIKNVSKSYGPKEVIHNLNLTIEPGKIVGLIGPNGAGKSTIINMITGITNITKGDIFVCSKSIISDEIAVKKSIGLVTDTPDSFIYYTPTKYFEFLINIYEVRDPNIEEKIMEYVKRFEIEKYMDTVISDLSHGTRQKVFIIGSILHDPKVWILDEPMVGLDPKASRTLKEIMKEQAKDGKTVLFSTHVLEVAEKLCNGIVIISEGDVVYNGTYEELEEKYKEDSNEELSLEDLFLKITDGKKE